MTTTPSQLHPLVKNLQGQRFGRLLVLEHVGTVRGRRASWRCKCDCGATVIVASPELLCGKTRSCGCLAQEVRRDLLAKHGQSKLPEFHSWMGVLARCNNPKHPGYPTHGGRGIECRWATFDELVGDVGPRPSPEHRLVRLDPHGHFEPGNCAWLTRREQGRLHSNYGRHKK